MSVKAVRTVLVHALISLATSDVQSDGDALGELIGLVRNAACEPLHADLLKAIVSETLRVW